MHMRKECLMIILGLCFFFEAGAQRLRILPHDTAGRIFEGVGALSAGASSRLLIDYPEPYRSDILDFLFKPYFGANLWQLKVENGGDVNSTDGAELAYAHNREEFNHPRAGQFNRGYEWWLIKEAKKRNPAIQVEILQWGTPGWIDSFNSRDNARFIAGYIKGLKKFHDIEVDYTGIHNEVMYDKTWIKQLRQTLDAEGLTQVRIDAGDQWKPKVKWQIAEDIAQDSALRAAVYAINAHVPEETDFYLPPRALQINKPIWSGESHAPGGDWYAAAKIARLNNRAYSRAKITKMIYWSLITAYPDYLTAPGSGMMKANSPWSGYYAVQPPLWMYAHINQFAQPGWRYVNSGCHFFKREGWSVITLKDPESEDYSMIIATMNAKEAHTLTVRLPEDFSRQPLRVWASAFKQFLFQQQADIVPKDDTFSLTVAPNTIYSLTTTTGQHKGMPAHRIPLPTAFPANYADDFDHDSLHREPPYFINYHGAFEVVQAKDSKNRYLKQGARKQGINWLSQPYPILIMGDSAWSDVHLEVDFRLPDTGTVRLGARMHRFSWNSAVPGYYFEIDQKGYWQLRAGDTVVLARGQQAGLKNKWHHLALQCEDDHIQVQLDNQLLFSLHDDRYSSGVVALSTGWNVAFFDRFKITTGTQDP